MGGVAAEAQGQSSEEQVSLRFPGHLRPLRDSRW